MQTVFAIRQDIKKNIYNVLLNKPEGHITRRESTKTRDQIFGIAGGGCCVCAYPFMPR